MTITGIKKKALTLLIGGLAAITVYAGANNLIEDTNPRSTQFLNMSAETRSKYNRCIKNTADSGMDYDERRKVCLGKKDAGIDIYSLD